MKFGVGEFKSGGYCCEFILVDCVEVIIVVIYLDKGMD